MPFIPDNSIPTPGFKPDEAPKPTPNFQPDRPKPGLIQRAKQALTGILTNPPEARATKAALNLSNKADTAINKFRSETIPGMVPKSIADKTSGVPTPGTIVRAAGSYLTSGAIPVKPKIQSVKDTVKQVSETVIPTTKEAGAVALGGSLIKGAIKPATRLLEKLSPKFAASQTVKREVEALGRMAKNKLAPEMGSVRELLPGQSIKTSKNVLQAIELKDGTILYDRAAEAMGGHGKLIKNLGDLDPKLQNHAVQNLKSSGIVTKSGQYVKDSPSGKALLKFKEAFNRPPTASPEDIEAINKFTKEAMDEIDALGKQDIDKLVKEVVGDIDIPNDPDFVPIISRYEKPSVARTAVDRIVPQITALRRQGPAGVEIARSFREIEVRSQVMAGKAKEHVLPALSKVQKSSPEEYAKIADYIEPRFGAEPPKLTGEAKAAADGLVRELKAWGRFAEKEGIQVMTKDGPRNFIARNKFMPAAPDIPALQKPAAQQLEIRNLVKTKQAETEEDAREILSVILKAKTNILTPSDFIHVADKAKKLGTFERPRVYTLLHVDRDPIKQSSNYFDRGANRLMQIRYLGQDSGRLKMLVDSVKAQGGDYKLVQEIADQFLKTAPINERESYAVRQLKAFQGATKLGLSTLSNMQQGVVNSQLRAQSLPVTKRGFFKSFTQEGISWARETGVVDNKAAAKYMEDMAGISDDEFRGFMEKAADKTLTGNLFKASEVANRIQAANIGREYAISLGNAIIKNPKNKKVAAELLEFGIKPEDVIRRGKITRNELLHASNIFVGETQFGNRTLNLPHIYAKHPLIGQLSSFIVPQGSLTLKMMKKKPIGTTANILGASATTGALSLIGGRVLRGRDAFEEEETKGHPLMRAAQFAKNSIMQGGFGGKLGSIIQSSNYGPTGVLKSLAGPSAGDAAEAITAVGQGNKKALMKLALKSGLPLATVMIPGIRPLGAMTAPYITNKLFPSKRNR